MKINSFFVKIHFFFIIFFTTLHSFYFYNISLAPFPVLAVFLSLFGKLNKKNIYFSFLYLFFFLFTSIIGFFQAGSSFYFNSFLGVVLGPLFFGLFLSIIKDRQKDLVDSIELVLVVHLFAFFLQYFVFYFFNYKIDYLVLITGEESRIDGYGVLTDLVRSSGLFNEPASYSLYIGFFSIILLIYNRKINPILFFSFISCLISFSVSGILYAFLAYFIYFIFIKRSILNLLSWLVFVFFFILYFGLEYFELFLSYFENRFLGDDLDGSTNVRFKEGFDYFFNLDYFIQLFGLGVGNYPINVSTVASGFMSIFLHFGYFFTFIFIILNFYILKKYKVKFKFFFIFIFFLTSTMTFLNLHYWLFLALIIIFSDNKNSNILIHNTN